MSHVVSASQIDTFLTCERKWGWKYLAGKKEPPNRSAQCGTRVHEILELWLSKAVPPNPNEELTIDGHTYYPGLIAMSGMHALPPPGPHLNTERQFRFGHWLGYVDLAYLSVENTPVIYDHKTTGDLVWAKSADVLKTDVQAILYANAALLEMPDAPHVDLCWNYMQTRKPYKHEAVRLRVLREYATEALRPFDAIAQKLIALKDGGARALELPPNARSCDAYGGCPHRLDCNLSPEQIMRSKMARERTLEEKIADAAAAASAGPHTNGAPVPLPPPLTPEVLVLKDGWKVHPGSAAHGWNPATNEVLPIEQVIAPAPPPPPVPAAPPPPPPAAPPPPPAVAVVSAPLAPMAPPAINPPEATPEDRREPVVDTGPAAVDELDGMDKATLRATALKEGVREESLKGLREAGMRTIIRKERLIRGRGLDVPSVLPPAPPAPVSGVVAVAAHAIAPPAPAAPTAPLVSAAELEATDDMNHVMHIACALLIARERFEDDLELARRARSIHTAIKRVVGA